MDFMKARQRVLVHSMSTGDRLTSATAVAPALISTILQPLHRSSVKEQHTVSVNDTLGVQSPQCFVP